MLDAADEAAANARVVVVGEDANVEVLLSELMIVRKKNAAIHLTIGFIIEQLMTLIVLVQSPKYMYVSFVIILERENVN